MRTGSVKYSIVWGVLVSAGLVACTKMVNGFLASSGVQHQLQNAYSVAPNEDILQLVFLIHAYRKLKNDWPADKDNLMEVDWAIDSVNNLRHFKDLKFEPYTDSVRVDYALHYTEERVDKIKSIVGKLTFLKKDSVVSYQMRGVPKVERVDAKE